LAGDETVAKNYLRFSGNPVLPQTLTQCRVANKSVLSNVDGPALPVIGQSHRERERERERETDREKERG